MNIIKISKIKTASTNQKFMWWWTSSTVWTAAASDGQALAEIETPAFLMFGRDPIIPLGLMVGDSIQEVPPIKLDALSKLRERSNDRTVESSVGRMTWKCFTSTAWRFIILTQVLYLINYMDNLAMNQIKWSKLMSILGK